MNKIRIRRWDTNAVRGGHCTELLRMAEHYRDLAAHESWAHENPPSVSGITSVLSTRGAH